MKRASKRRDPVLELVRSMPGTAPRIAAACGIVRVAVWNWDRVPAKHVLTVEELLKIPRHRIRPDLYPPPNDPQTRKWLTSNRRKQHGVRAWRQAVG